MKYEIKHQFPVMDIEHVTFGSVVRWQGRVAIVSKDSFTPETKTVKITYLNGGCVETLPWGREVEVIEKQE